MEKEIFKEGFEGEPTSFYGSILGALLPEGMERGAGSTADNAVRCTLHSLLFGTDLRVLCFQYGHYYCLTGRHGYLKKSKGKTPSCISIFK